MKAEKKNSPTDLMKYMGFAFQFMTGLGLFMYLGFKLDNWLNFSTPIAIWLFPLLFITAVIIRVIIDTNKK